MESNSIVKSSQGNSLLAETLVDELFVVEALVDELFAVEALVGELLVVEALEEELLDEMDLTITRVSSCLWPFLRRVFFLGRIL